MTSPEHEELVERLAEALHRQGRRNTVRAKVLRVYATVYPPLRAVSFRYRTELWPITIGMVLLEARIIVTWYPPLTVAGVSAQAAVAVLYYLRRDLDRRAEWVYALSCLTATVLGATLTAQYGHHIRALNVACALGWWIASCIWWLHHRRHGTGGRPNIFVRRWNARIGNNNGR